MSNPVIQTNELTKVYSARTEFEMGLGTFKRVKVPETKALSNLSLDVQPGEIFGYLGPNGAGKTTTIRLLLDLIRPTRGQATILGKDANADSVELHRQIGFLPGELNLWKNRTGKQVINYAAEVRGGEIGKKSLKEADVLAERLSFDVSKKVRDYSSGNKRKLGLILALMHKPDLLILDEPTGGLDPLVQQTFNELVMEAKSEGRTVFLSSHILSEVQAICDRVGILRDGELKAVETVSNLTRTEFHWVQIDLRDAAPAGWKAALEGIEGVSEVTLDGKSVSLRLHGDFDPVFRVVSDGYIANVQVKDPSLEEIFLAFYGNNRRA